MDKDIDYIDVKDLKIPIKIKSYKKSKTIKIYFKDGILTVTKPFYVAKYKIYSMIEKNKDDIYGKYKKVLEQEKSKKNWYEKEKIYFMGDEYKIKIIPIEDNKINILINKDEKSLEIKISDKIDEKNKKFYLDKGIKELFKLKTKKILEEKLPYWADVMNLKYSSFKVRDAKSKYGSCKVKTKELYFSSRLIMLPENVIDAIIVHELAHIVYANHSKSFYELIEKYIVDYKQIDKWLRKNSDYIML